MSTEVKKGSAWSKAEISSLYHLVTWGYTNKQICNIAASINLLPGRSFDAVNAETVQVRKFVNQCSGQIIMNPITETEEAKFNAASKIAPSDAILGYKKDDVTVRTINKALRPEEAIPQPTFAVETIKFTEEPNILDVMKLAKELGAKEVEYSGMNVKF